MALNNVQRLIFQNLPALRFNSNVARSYSRWSHRKPTKVILPFEPTAKVNLKKEKVIDLSPKIPTRAENSEKETKASTFPTEATKTLPKKKSQEILEKREEKLKKIKYYLHQKRVFNDSNEIIFEKLKDNDGRISNLLVKLKSKKERIKSGQVLVEGWRLIADGLEAKCPLNYLIFSRTEDLNQIRPFLPKTGVQIFKIPYKEIQMWSDLETPPGIFGVFETPREKNINVLPKPLPLQIICDNIRVPGNLGTILRVAVGAGAEKVVLTKGCVDAWDSKVIRSAAGAHFRLPIHNSVEWEDIPNHLDENTSVFIADSNSNFDDSQVCVQERSLDGLSIPVLPYYGVDFTTLKSITLIIGGETEGISKYSYALAERCNGLRLNIPLQKGVDSLNTGMAAAIITFEIKKQILQAIAKEKLTAKST